MGGRLNARLSRVKKLEMVSARLSDLDAMSDDDLMVAVFGYDTPELRASQALERAGDDAGFERMLRDVAESDAERRKGRAH